MPAMSKAPFQLRDMVIHKKMDIVGQVVFVDVKKSECRVCVDDDMPVENWGFAELELYQKAPGS